MTSASAFDQSVVLSWNKLITVYPLLGFLARNIAVYGVYTIPLAWLIWWFVASKIERYHLLSSMFAGVIAWQGFNRISKLFYAHPRPTNDLPVQEFLFERPENSFPSDHTAFLAGIAFFFVFQKQRRISLILLAITMLISISRIAVAVHYPSDILGGFTSGLIAAWIVFWLNPRLLPLWDKLIGLAKRLKLA